jgi:hypothetical protein
MRPSGLKRAANLGGILPILRLKVYSGLLLPVQAPAGFFLIINSDVAASIAETASRFSANMANAHRYTSSYPIISRSRSAHRSKASRFKASFASSRAFSTAAEGLM